MCGKKITMSQPMIYSSVYYLLFSLQFQLKISSICTYFIPKKLYVDDEIYIAYFIATHTGMNVPPAPKINETKNCTSIYICSFIITFLTFFALFVWFIGVVVVVGYYIGIEMGSENMRRANL